MLQEPTDDGMARFVQRYGPPVLLAHQVVSLRQATHHPLGGTLEVLHVNGNGGAPGGENGGLVANVGNVCSDEAWRQRRHALGDALGVQLLGQANRLEVHLEDGLPLVQIRLVDGNRSVEAARPNQRRIQDVHTVGACQHDDAGSGSKAIHLHQQLIESVLPLVIAASTEAAFATLATHCVDLIDEDDGGGGGTRLGEEVADSRRADTHKHLDEVGATHGIERAIRLASDRLRQESLTSARRSDEQATFGHAGAKRLVLGGVLQEVDELHDLFLGLLQAGDIAELDLRLEVFLPGREGFADGEDVTAPRSAAAAPGAAHATGHRPCSKQ
mmetsp:Transcript_72663/g.183960  ORF Transcript_72663/g.183960 Transcript_72663/m.183960 type:complete len:329 (-) Transcript_72663:657-1643(-)